MGVADHSERIGIGRLNRLDETARLGPRHRTEEDVVVLVGVHARCFPSGHARPALTRTRLGRCRLAMRDYEHAESLLVESYPIIREAYGEQHEWTLEAAGSIVELLKATDRSENVSTILSQSIIP